MNKIFKSAIRFVIRCIRKLFPPADVFFVYYGAWRRGNKVIRRVPCSVKSYCESTGGKITTVEDEKDRVVFEPAYFGKSEARELVFRSHDIYIAEITNVSVHGGTGLMISEDKALTDVCANDVENRVKYTSGPISRGRKSRFYLEVSDGIEEVDTAVNLCGLAASNYYHLTFEILSRFGYLKDYLKDNDIPVLIDEGARKFPQFEDLVKTVLDGSRAIFVPEYKRVHCKKVIYPSMNTWMPMNVRRKSDFRLSDNLIAESAVLNIREATRNLRVEKSDTKIFVSRKNASLSRVANESEVAELFRKAGYRIVCTEELSYKEQVELFSSAACVVGASGAALANLAYCSPGAVFGCIIPQKYEFCVYSTIAYFACCKPLFLDTRITKGASSISVEQYKVDMKECAEYISKIQSMI